MKKKILKMMMTAILQSHSLKMMINKILRINKTPNNNKKAIKKQLWLRKKLKNKKINSKIKNTNKNKKIKILMIKTMIYTTLKKNLNPNKMTRILI